MKKILIFSLAYYPHVGGAEVSIKEITDRIRDIEFHMITLRFSAHEPAFERIGNVHVYRVGGSNSYFSKMFFVLTAARAAQKLHAQQKFNGLWAMMSYMVLPIVIAKLELPYALTLQEGDTEDHMFGRLRIVPFIYLLRKGFRNATVVSALSTYLSAWAEHMGYKGAVEVIPNGADVERFSGPKIPHAGTVVITSSRLVHKNAVDDVIRAISLVPDVRFQIAGEGPDKAKLKALAHELRVESRIEWLGYVDHARLATLLHSADIYARPSRSEGFGASFAEAMAAEIPIIATQEGGLKDFISPEVAWPVEKDRPDQIAKQIKAILANPEHTKNVVANAKQLVMQKYDWNLIARDMRDKVFAKII